MRQIGKNKFIIMDLSTQEFVMILQDISLCSKKGNSLKMWDNSFLKVVADSLLSWSMSGMNCPICGCLMTKLDFDFYENGNGLQTGVTVGFTCPCPSHSGHECVLNDIPF